MEYIPPNGLRSPCGGALCASNFAPGKIVEPVVLILTFRHHLYMRAPACL